MNSKPRELSPNEHIAKLMGWLQVSYDPDSKWTATMGGTGASSPIDLPDFLGDPEEWNRWVQPWMRRMGITFKVEPTEPALAKSAEKVERYIKWLATGEKP